MHKKLKFKLSILLSFFILSLGNASVKESHDILPSEISIFKSSFVDEHGRHILLNGVNLVNKNKATKN